MNALDIRCDFAIQVIMNPATRNMDFYDVINNIEKMYDILDDVRALGESEGYNTDTSMDEGLPAMFRDEPLLVNAYRIGFKAGANMRIEVLLIPDHELT